MNCKCGEQSFFRGLCKYCLHALVDAAPQTAPQTNSEKCRAYYRRHREKELARKKEYYRLNRERILRKKRRGPNAREEVNA
jgi:hypothetical protein